MPLLPWATDTFPTRRLSVVLLVTGFGLASAAALDCESKPPPPPVGYHSPNIVWSGTHFAVAWAARGDDDRVMFAVMGKNGWETRPTRISRKAYETDPPLVASNGDTFLMAWTHVARRKAGLYIRELTAAGKGRKEAQIVEGPVTLCRQLVWADDGYSLAWIAEGGVYFGRVTPGANSPTITTKVEPSTLDSPETEGPLDCRLAWSGQHYGLLLADRSATGKGTLQLVTLDASREVVGRAVVAGGDATIRPQELVWNGSAFVLAYTIDGQPGAGMARVGPRADLQWRGNLPGTTGFVRGVGIGASTPTGVIWAESETAEDTRGHVYLALMPTDGRVGERTRLTEEPHGRFVVNATGVGDMLGVGWSIDIHNGGEVRWRGFSFDKGSQDFDAADLRAASEL